MNLNLRIQSLCGNMAAVVHIGKLETVIQVDADELSLEARLQIEKIIHAHLETIDTSKLLAKLAN